MSTPKSSSTPTTRKPPVMTAKSTASPSRSPTRTPAQPASASNTPTAASRASAARSVKISTPISARAAAKRDIDASSDEARAETLAAMEDLKERLKAAETERDQGTRDVAVLQSRLDESAADITRLEEALQEHRDRIQEAEDEKKETLRARRELESAHEAERAMAIKEREEWQTKQEAFEETIQRLKDRELRVEEPRPNLSRSSSFRSNASPNPESGSFALQRSDSRNSSRLVLQKDKIIESLRLELAESQIKLIEMENQGGGRLQELERMLMDTRVANARLMEENESFQLLLSEKTLNGDLAQSEVLQGSASLADELESAVTDDEEPSGSQSPVRRARAPGLAELQEQNRAMTLYINSIIGRLMQHKELESILDRDPGFMSNSAAVVNKDLPPPPPPKDAPVAATPVANTQSFFQRAASVVRSSRNVAAPEPSPSPTSGGGFVGARGNEDPATAPRIPLVRSQSMRAENPLPVHRRGGSDHHQDQPKVMAAPPPRTSSYFSRTPSGNAAPSSDRRRESLPPGTAPLAIRQSSSSRTSVPSEPDSAESGPASPPRSIASVSGERAIGAVMAGNKPRPLRLVQEAADQDEAAKKAANRGSWMGGWFNKAPVPGAAPPGGGSWPTRTFSSEN